MSKWRSAQEVFFASQVAKVVHYYNCSVPRTYVPRNDDVGLPQFIDRPRSTGIANLNTE